MANPIEIAKKSFIRRTNSENEILSYGKLPPQNKEMEEVVLGAVLIERDCIEDIISFMKDEVFYIDAHQRIWRAVESLYAKNAPIDLLTVTAQLKEHGDLDSAGGAFYVAQLTNKIGSASNVEYHARLIYEEYIKRKTISISTETIKEAYDDTNDAFEVLEKAEKNLSLLAENKFGNEGQTIGSSMRQEMNLIEARMSMEENELTGVPSGFHEVDRIIGGWQKSDLIIVAGRPASGKCLGIDTPVIMYDGSVKKVQDIIVGDLLMGVDSKPREVMSLARGREMMYWVKQKFGMDYCVNESHIISLDKKFDGSNFIQEDIVNVEILNYLEMPTHLRDNLVGYKYGHLDKKIFGRTPIWLEKYKVDDYYGFTLDKDGLFLLGDGTVTHNTAASLNFARNAAIIGKRSVAFFSLEMSTAQLTQRLISGEAEIANDRIRNGKLNDGEWSRLTSSLDYLASASMVIDDTPALSIMELKAKARRLKKDHDIELIVIDYLQLMSGTGAKLEGSREQEVSAISRGLKALAKELNIPVIALSQLSRAVETRGGEHKPILSDLRESGCVTGDTLIFDPIQNKSITILDLFKNNKHKNELNCLTLSEGIIINSEMSNVFYSGKKEVFELTTSSGRKIKASANHPFMKKEGWARLDELKIGDEIASIELNKNILFWDEIISIIYVGIEDVYDATVPNSHNFVANGILIHNSIEADADIVIFLYRPEYYGLTTDAEGNSTEGIGYFNIAKHRNGELKECKVEFQGQYTKFKNLVNGGGFSIENHTQNSERSGSSVSNTALNKKYIDKHREEQRDKKTNAGNDSIQQSSSDYDLDAPF